MRTNVKTTVPTSQYNITYDEKNAKKSNLASLEAIQNHGPAARYTNNIKTIRHHG